MTRHLQPMHRGEKGNSQCSTKQELDISRSFMTSTRKKHLGYVNTALRGNRFNMDKGLDLPWNLGRSTG